LPDLALANKSPSFLSSNTAVNTLDVAHPGATSPQPLTQALVARLLILKVTKFR